MPTPTAEMKLAEMVQKIAALEKANAELKAQQSVQRSITLKVSEKGAVSVYGLGRFPVTLYSEQWPRLLAEAKTILAFIEVNRAKLSTKADKVTAASAPTAVTAPTTGAL